MKLVQTNSDRSFRAIDGPTLRQRTIGPETELVDEYIQTHFSAPSQDQKLTIFIEPRIESGFPDIVGVYWDPSVTNCWPDDRKILSKTEIRLLHAFYLTAGSRNIDISVFQKSHGRKRIDNTIARLHAAGVIDQIDGKWKLKPLNEIFAVRRIVAIEAKISAWQHGLQQAMQNTWFASESFLLLPRIPVSSTILEDAYRLGIGVVSKHTPLEMACAHAQCEHIPKSYASWEFNEWTWRSHLIDNEMVPYDHHLMISHG